MWLSRFLQIVSEEYGDRARVSLINYSSIYREGKKIKNIYFSQTVHPEKILDLTSRLNKKTEAMPTKT